ncbi:MAG: response regulator transcription factor [Flavobacteriales bacterium]|nr:response regulator transcription factor [Flavobacteriales bacterium]
MEPKEPVRLVLCDDHCIVTDGLKRLLQDVPWVECVGTANSGQEAIFLLEHVPADMVIMDLTMPGMDGAETMGRIKLRWPEIKVIILTMNDEIGVIRRLMDQGADGYLLKSCGRDELLRAVQGLHAGRKHFSSEITEALLVKRTETAASDARLSGLSVREREVLSALAEGLSNKEIGERLFISPRTVDTHRTNLMKKVGVHNLAGLVRLAVSAGLVS